MVEGRDHVAGESVILVGRAGDRGEDLYVVRDSGPAGQGDLDLIAAARTYLPGRVDEVRTFRAALDRVAPSATGADE
ncbi:hypothetical protein GC089_16290 [Cellulomonas sp. JZ18]|uniref:hypothetical protein n=1 Tax=Cellulomonas sp. JZ18 TaxID=2654191 RepID=UPI0012D3E83B|nr:hypothetical protein [Cellulomonas sp. JZ18]QGQ20463.1 hypothetical protein GC089_16290 [Cellulomonas sp. JZ18]